jgi:hypothetical protein
MIGNARRSLDKRNGPTRHLVNAMGHQCRELQVWAEALYESAGKDLNVSEDPVPVLQQNPAVTQQPLDVT